MIYKTSQTRVLFRHCHKLVGLAVFGVFLIILTVTGLPIEKAQAATTNTLNFQARLQTTPGAIVPDGFYNVQFKLYDVPTGGTALWTESHIDTNGGTAGNDFRLRVKNGYLTANLGSQTTFPTTINWDQDLYITMNIGGTTQTATPTYDGEMSPRLRLTGVPYAFRAGQLAKYNSTTGFTSSLELQNPTGGNQIFQVADQGAAGTYNLLTQQQANGAYIQLQAATPGTQQTGNLNISGAGIFGGSLTVGNGTTGTLNLGDGQISKAAGTGFVFNSNINAQAGLYTGSGTGVQRIDSVGNIINVGTITATGAISTTGDLSTASTRTVQAEFAGGESNQWKRIAVVNNFNGMAQVRGVIGGHTFGTAGEGQTWVDLGFVYRSGFKVFGTASGRMPVIAGANADLIAATDGTTVEIYVEKTSFTQYAFTTQKSGGATLYDDAWTSTDPRTRSGWSSVFGLSDNLAGTVAQAVTFNGTATPVGKFTDQNFGIGNTTAAYKLDVTGDINTTTGYRVGGTAGASTTCTGGQLLQNAVVSGGIVTGGSCIAPAAGGVTAVGAVSATPTANGATITGTTLNLAVADGTNAGLLSTTAQTIGGAKTFSSSLNTASGNAYQINGANVLNESTLSFTAASAAIIQSAASQALNITGNAASTISTTAGDLTLQSTAANVSIQAASTNAILIGTANSNTITLGTTTATSTITVGRSTATNTISIGSANTSTGNTQTISIGAGTPTGTGNAQVTIGNANANSAVTLRAGTGGINVLGVTNINTSGSGSTNIGTGTNSGTVTIGNNSAPNAIRLAADNIDLTLLGALTKITSLGVGDITMSGAFIQNNATGFTSGTGATSFRGSTIGIGDATTDRTTITAQIQGGSPLVFQGVTDNAFATTLAVTDPTANNIITLPNYSGTVVASSNAGASGECLKSNGTASAPSYGVCGTGSASTLQDAYTASGSTNPQITLSNANGGLKIRDGSTPVSGNLFQLQNNVGTATYFGVSASAATLQDTSGNDALVFDSTTSRLRIYENTTAPTRYLELYYDTAANEAVVAASSGTTRIGGGSGNITLSLGNVVDVLTASKTATLSGAYSDNDFTFSRNLTAGANALTGSVVSIESLSSSSGSNAASTILRLNENNTNATGSLIVATKGGVGNEKFKVDTGGTVTIANNESYTGVGIVNYTGAAAVNVSSGSGNLKLQAGGANATVVRATTNSANTFNIQDSVGNVEFQVDTSAGQYSFGANGIIAGARLGVRTTGSLDVLRLLNSSSATVFSVGSTGDTLVKPSTATTNAFQVQNTSSAILLSADTTNSRIQIGSSTTDTTAILLVLDSYNVAADPTGVDGAMYYNTALQEFRCRRDGAWEPCATKPIDRAYIIDEEFISGATAVAGTGIGNLNWNTTTITTACASVAYNGGSGGAAISANRPGIFRMTTAATAANIGCRLGLGSAGANSTMLAASQVMKTAVAVDNATTVSVRVGLTTENNTNHTTAPTTGIWWEADTAQNANWRYCYGTGAAATCAASSVAITANTFVRLETRLTATGAGSSAATFIINGTSINVSNVTIATAATVRPIMGCTTLAAAVRTCYIDYYAFRGDASAAR